MGEPSTNRPSVPTPRPSSSNIAPNTSNDNSPESNANSGSNKAPVDSASSPSPTSPTGTNPRPGHGRIASTSTSHSRPEGYPSWLPRRPPPPEPASTVGAGTRPSTRAGYESPDSLGAGEIDWEFITGEPGGEYAPEEVPMPADSEAGPSVHVRRHTHTGLPTDGPSSPMAPKGERKPTPRSVRIMSVPGLGPALVQQGTVGTSREATDSTRVPSGAYRAYSRATGASALSPTMVGSVPSRGGYLGQSGRFASEGKSGRIRHSMPPSIMYRTPTPFMGSMPPLRPPRFRTPKFHPTLLKDPSRVTRLRWWAWWIAVVFGHMVLQTFLDFNIAYMIIQVARHPTPSPLGSSSSAHNWTLAAVAYIACWAIWLLGIVICYEAIYCFWRRWRVKRPLVIPIYLSAPAYNIVCLTSYTNFCFLQHIRWSALNSYMAITDGDSSVSSLRRRAEKVQDEATDATNPVRRSEEGGEAEVSEPVQDVAPKSQDDPHNDSNGTDPISYVNSSDDSPTSQSGAAKKHNRNISQAQTFSSVRSRPRTSDGFESSGPGSEGRPPISELASSREDLASPTNDDEIQQQRPREELPPIGSRRRAADGSAFFEHRMSYSSTDSGSSVGSARSPRDILQFVAETCWFYSQNLPTVVVLIPRLALTLALYMAFVGPSTGASLGIANGLGRDGTFFSGRGQLSVYAKVIIWIQIAWGLWRCGVLIASWLGLWMLSGMGCAGLCGPRYRWEESFERDDAPPLPYARSHDKRMSERAMAKQPEDQGAGQMVAHSRMSIYTVDDARFADRMGRRAFTDPDDHTINWSWMERCRDRVWDTWEFCLTRSSGKAVEAQDAYWSAWRSAVSGGPLPGNGNGNGDDQMAEKRRDTERLTVSFGTTGPTPSAFSPPLSSTTTAAGTPIPFIPASMVNFQHFGFGGGDTVLSTLPEMSSNPSLAASAAPSAASPAKSVTQPAAPSPPLPIFSTPAPKRGVLSNDLFIAPTSSAPPGPAADAAWLGSSAVPLTPPAATAYPFTGYSSENPPQATAPKTTLPFPLVPAPQTAQTQSNQVRQTVFPTPATTVQSLPFPNPQPAMTPEAESPQRPEEHHYPDEDDFSGPEHGVLSPGRYPPSQGTGSMSSLGQPLQSKYPQSRSSRGRRSSASGGGSLSASQRESETGSRPPYHRSPRGSFISASTSGYGSQVIIRRRASRSNRTSQGSQPYDGDYTYDDLGEEASEISSGAEPGMAGVGAGGGMGPRASLVNLAIPSSPLGSVTSYPPPQNIDPPPRHSHSSRRRAGTLPSEAGVPVLPVIVPQPWMSRTRVSSVPSPVSRDFASPSTGYDVDMAAFARAHGFGEDYEDSDDDEGGSQEAAEKEDSIGLLSQAPSRRSSASALRSRGSNISLHRRPGNSRPVSITSAAQNVGVRSRTASLIRSPPASASVSRESLNSGSRGSVPAAPEPRVRTNSGAAARSEKTGSQYSDARTHSETSSGDPRLGGNDLTFGVQVDWRGGDATRQAPPADEPVSPRTLLPEPATVRPRRSNLGASSTSLVEPEAGPSTLGLPRSQPLAIPGRRYGGAGASRQDLSSADASFVTAMPAPTTDSDSQPPQSEHAGSSVGTWGPRRGTRHFAEGGPEMWGPQ